VVSDKEIPYLCIFFFLC